MKRLFFISVLLFLTSSALASSWQSFQNSKLSIATVPSEKFSDTRFAVVFDKSNKCDAFVRLHVKGNFDWEDGKRVYSKGEFQARVDKKTLWSIPYSYITVGDNYANVDIPLDNDYKALKELILGNKLRLNIGNFYDRYSLKGSKHHITKAMEMCLKNINTANNDSSYFPSGKRKVKAYNPDKDFF